MELKDSVRVMTKEEFESAINEDIKFVEGIKHFFKHDDATRVMEHVKSVLEASVDYHYPNHPEPEAEPGDMGEVSDGYHTFNELYRYRMLYNAAFFNLLARNGQVEVCKSRKHSDGEKCFGSDDWFIVMAMLPTGQVSNHYESKYWDLFDVPERETAFEYDGHTPNEAADRLEQYLNQKKSGLTFEEAFKFLKDGNMIKRRGWKNEHLDAFRRSGVGSIHMEKSLIIIINEETRRLTSWNPSIEDISSNDWEITK
jgi:hypothetical protein